ncbi:hypothetical protein ABZ114_10300 [Streptomyces albidoflavus]|uniref:hypothetical protein n=1 Tax=Streptomyces TaxID=1883 RepID=UPI00063EA869|nr:hypothetical protein [Streptomyces sp. KE1]KLJ00207.1 hypothetical protein WQ59_15950 [Streptomyces sp. KE1]
MAPPKPRLTDWQPLSDTDPVPGDPQAVRDEIKHLNSVKDELNKQADRLKGIRDDDELRGKYATTLKEEAEVLEGQLRDVARRYGRVVVPLGKWATELEQFQSEADTVCGRAAARQEELDAEDKAAKEKNPDPSPTDHESDPLRSLRTDLAKVLHERDTQGNKRAREIRDAINNDGVEDSPWDDLIGWVHENADWIKVVIDVLGWVATALAVVALFIPGLNIAVFLLIAGLVVVGTRLLLVASGDASWMDVAIDSFGLLTMGIGRVGVGMLRGASTAARASARSARLLAGVRAHRGIMNELSTALATTTGGAATKAAIRGLMNTVRRGIIDDAAGAAINPGAVSRMTRLLHLGDDEVASLAANVARNAEALPGAVSSGTQALARGGQGLAQAAAWGGLAVDLGDKSLGQSDAFAALHDAAPLLPDKPFLEPYNSWKGDTWKPPVSNAW